MLALTAATRIYLYRGVCDMRKSFDGLCGIIRSDLGADPLSGSLFVFVNRRRSMITLLYWDRDGLALWYKRLEQRQLTILQHQMVISVEVSEKLEYRPGRLIVNVYKRPQYALPEGNDTFGGVIAAAMPDHPIEKCKADVGLLAHVIVSKFADHLPLYRQDGIFEREGVMIPRATQSSWLMQLYESVKPLEETFRQALFESDVLFTDDTPVPLQGKG
ncbi:MAG: hypothetical protein C0394_12055, partial [Syntrophus sp. (in: bacteria)]|nr:hypothetical protein [Syntrophus sp. (in: bacteria)]